MNRSHFAKKTYCCQQCWQSSIWEENWSPVHPLQCAAKSERLEKLLLHSCSAINMLSIFNVVGIISIMIIAIVIIKMIIIIMFPSKSTCPRSLLCRCSECLHRVLSSEASSVNKSSPTQYFQPLQSSYRRSLRYFIYLFCLPATHFVLILTLYKPGPLWAPLNLPFTPLPLFWFSHTKMFFLGCAPSLFLLLLKISLRQNGLKKCLGGNLKKKTRHSCVFLVSINKFVQSTHYRR